MPGGARPHEVEAYQMDRQRPPHPLTGVPHCILLTGKLIAFANLPARFLPEPQQRPLLTFGAPWIQYVHRECPFNATDQLLDRTVRRLGAERTAIVVAESGERWSYGRLQGAVNRFGNGLLRLGLQPADRVVLRLPDSPAMAVAQLAIWKLGGVVVPTAIVERAREIEFIVNDTEARFLVTHADHLDEVEKVRAGCPTLQTVVAFGGAGDHVSAEQLLAEQPEDLAPYPNRSLDASGVYYTGGTTGHPKGCIHTHAAEVVLADLNGLARGAGPEDVFLTHAPMGHAFGNGERINFPFRVGAAAIYVERLTPATMLEFAERYRATILAGAATMYRMVLRELEQRGGDAPRLQVRNALSSGEILDELTYDRWQRTFGFPLRNTVGMTPVRHLFLDPNLFGEKVAPGLSVGAPLPGYEARLVDPFSAAPAPEGEPGRLALRGPTGITYWINRHPFIRERARADVVDGWSLLDDSYRRDEEGWLWFQARLDDMIVSGGRQIAAPEVEGILARHPAVAEVAVVAAPDEIRGQVVKAFVVLKPGHLGDQDMVRQLQEFARAEMATYKYPRVVEFIDELPKDQVGKVQRRRLRERSQSLRRADA